MTLKLEVPGIPQEDLQINLENQTLTVKGERKFVKDEKEENFHRIERRYGSFVRNFTLPATFETESAQASYENGVLSITAAEEGSGQTEAVEDRNRGRRGQLEGGTEAGGSPARGLNWGVFPAGAEAERVCSFGAHPLLYLVNRWFCLALGNGCRHD